VGGGTDQNRNEQLTDIGGGLSVGLLWAPQRSGLIVAHPPIHTVRIAMPNIFTTRRPSRRRDDDAEDLGGPEVNDPG
jgi:hypothetical protein